jgi:hypothetical protein
MSLKKSWKAIGNIMPQFLSIIVSGPVMIFCCYQITI